MKGNQYEECVDRILYNFWFVLKIFFCQNQKTFWPFRIVDICKIAPDQNTRAVSKHKHCIHDIFIENSFNYTAVSEALSVIILVN